MDNKRMTWAEIKKAYPKQVVGLVDCQPDEIGFDTAIVKYTDATTPYEIMCEKAFDGEISLRSTSMDDRLTSIHVGTIEHVF